MARRSTRRTRLVVLAMTLASCKLLESKPSARTSATATGEGFALFDDSGGNPVKGWRPNSRRKATVKVSLPPMPREAKLASIAVEVEASVRGASGDYVTVVLTMPDGKKQEHSDRVGSPLFFCPAPPQPCEATYAVEMEYHGKGGTGHVSWGATATARASGESSAPVVPAPIVKLALVGKLLPRPCARVVGWRLRLRLRLRTRRPMTNT
jgi:hypothetical protein